MGVSDEALLAGMAADDTDAAATFVRRHQARVYGLALTVVGVPALAEEVAQDAFVRAWRHAGSYDARRGRASTWLLTIARNAAIDVLRVRRELPIDPEAIADMLVAGRDVGDRLADSDRVTAALRSIPHEQAVAVVLSVHFGLTAQEISERQDIPLGTAKTRIRTGLARLRQKLEVSHG
ncbi:MAG TPA: sigma-70 family RNA polymerase sigma factor [Jiangellaceae bacterium]